MDWLHDISDQLAEGCGIDAATLTLDADARRALLDVARIASHATGNRTNAPLLCYVLGRAAAQGARLDEAIALVKAVTPLAETSDESGTSA